MIISFNEWSVKNANLDSLFIFRLALQTTNILICHFGAFCKFNNFYIYTLKIIEFIQSKIIHHFHYLLNNFIVFI